jgi:cobalt-zinc-cadmium efflux system outer membrane protein
VRVASLAFSVCLGLAAGAVPWALARADSGLADLGVNLEGLRQAGRNLNPGLRAAALDTQAASAKASGADALDDPTVNDSYQYYKDPGVFSAHTIMVSQSFPLWGKRTLRRQAALADVDAARGREQAARDETDERIKVAYAGWYATCREIAVEREILVLDGRMRAAAAARYGQGGGDEIGVIRVMDEQTAARVEIIRLEGDSTAASARLDALVGRRADAPLAYPEHARPVPRGAPPLTVLLDRAHAANPTLVAATAGVQAARTRSTLAAKAWYPDLTVGGGPLFQTNNRPVGFAAAVSVNIPVGWGREAAGEREAQAQLGASEQRYDAALLEVDGAIAEAAAKLQAARQTEALLRREAAPQARASFQASLAGYRQGKGDLASAIAAERLDHDVELRLLLVELDEQVELAAIERLIGGDL